MTNSKKDDVIAAFVFFGIVAILIFIASLSAGCKTSKKTIEQKTATSVKYDVEDYLREKEARQDKEQKEAVNELFSSIFQEYTHKILSKPDSAGNQYVTDIITGTAQLDITQKSAEKTDKNTQQEKSAEQTKKDKSTSDSKTQTNITEQIKVKSPFAANFIIIAISAAAGIALMVALYFILKRFKIIK